MGEQRHSRIAPTASKTHQGNRVCLKDTKHVEHVLKADPVQVEFLGEKGEDDLEAGHSGLVLTPLLPVVHQLLNLLPLLGVILDMVKVTFIPDTRYLLACLRKRTLRRLSAVYSQFVSVKLLRPGLTQLSESSPHSRPWSPLTRVTHSSEQSGQEQRGHVTTASGVN